MHTLEQLASQIPSMGGHKIAASLRRAAAEVAPEHAIVEVGTWFGAATAHLALGVRDAGHGVPIHCYDRWRATVSDVRKAAADGVTLTEGQDLSPLVRRTLDPFDVTIHYHQGDIREARWDGGPIGVYVDDAAKYPPTFHHMLRTFGPCFVPGETVLFLMDFHFWKKRKHPDFRCQYEFMRRHQSHFEFIENIRGSSIAVYRYVEPVDFNALTLTQMNRWVAGGWPRRIWCTALKSLGLVPRGQRP